MATKETTRLKWTVDGSDVHRAVGKHGNYSIIADGVGGFALRCGRKKICISPNVSTAKRRATENEKIPTRQRV